MSYHGNCHCGRVAFEVEGDIDEAIECNCSHCSRKGYLLWFAPRNQLTLHTPIEAMASYEFNRHVIRHHFCPQCGAPFALGTDPKGNAIVAVNVRCLPDLDRSKLTIKAVDGRSF